MSNEPPFPTSSTYESSSYLRGTESTMFTSTARDTNYLSFADRAREHHDQLVVCPELTGERSEDFDDLLKISHCCEITFRNLNVCPEGLQREDGVDIMRFSYLIAIINARVAAGLYAFTVKGGSSEILLRNVVITRPGKYVDIDLGNYSHNADGKTGKVTLDNVTREDGKPVRVRVGWADRPVIVGGNVEILETQSFFLKIYVHSKRLLAKLLSAVK